MTIILILARIFSIFNDTLKIFFWRRINEISLFQNKVKLAHFWYFTFLRKKKSKNTTITKTTWSKIRISKKWTLRYNTKLAVVFIFPVQLFLFPFLSLSFKFFYHLLSSSFFFFLLLSSPFFFFFSFFFFLFLLSSIFFFFLLYSSFSFFILLSSFFYFFILLSSSFYSLF